MLDKEQWFRYSPCFLLQIIIAGEHSSRTLLWRIGMELKMPAVKITRPSCLNRKTRSTNHCTEILYLFQLNLPQTSVNQKAVELMTCKHDT